MKSVVLSSGGVDSTTCLACAVDQYGRDNVISLSLFYGQKHDKELECARKISEYYKVKHLENDISNVMQYAGNVCSLMKDSNLQLKEGSYKEQMDNNDSNRVNSYVPFRNGLFLSIAAAVADSLFPDEEEVKVYYGAHADDSADAAYADCTPEFIESITNSIKLGTYGKVHIITPFKDASKQEVVREGLRLKVPYELTWSCYNGREKACGKCGTCIDRRLAFALNGVDDPIEYEED